MLTRCRLCCLLHVLLLPSFYHVNAEFENGEQLFSTQRLSEFNSYGDVTVFHTVIPQHCTSVKWSIVGLKDNVECPEATIYVGLQPGSIPIVNPYNTSFPANTNTQSQRDLNLFLLKTNQSLLLATDIPPPGDWYIVAFLEKRNDSKISQQGLGGLECRYFIQLGLFYQQLRYVPSLSTESKTVAVLTQQQTYAVYRFNIPALTKSVTFTYENCEIDRSNKSNSSSDLCPVGFRVSSDHLAGNLTQAINCQSQTSCSFTVNQPQDSTWYYVRVDLTSSIIVGMNLTLGVELLACTDADASDVAYLMMDSWQFTSNDTLPKWEHLYNYSVSYDEASENTPKSTPVFPSRTLINILSPPTSNLPSRDAQTASVLASWCPPVIRLSSFQLSNSNPFKIFIQNVINATGGFDVPPDSPVILKFQLDSVQDIGGTLIISADIGTETEDDPPEFNSETYITLCLRQGRIPHLTGTTISCDPAYSVTFSADDAVHKLPWNIPFPQAGVWYLSLESSCKSDTGMGPCNSTVLVSVDIGLYACIDGCGPYGDCRRSVDMGLQYYYCKCSRGYAGFGCTDDSKAWSQSYFLSRVLLLTLSNVFFILPCCLALKRRHFVPAVSYFCTLVFSSFYHACDSGSLCIMKYDTLQFCDFFSAFMAIFLTLITMARLPVPLKATLEILGAFGLALGTSYNRFSIWAVAVPVGVGGVVLLMSWSRRWYKRRQCYPTSRRRWLCFILPGIAVIVTGLCIFAFLETTDNYQYVHSAWHVAMAIGVLFLLPPREQSDYKLILNEPCDDDVLNIHQTSEHSSPITGYPSVII
ncbi:post-GPI attachment to proteins factor 6-like isoform X2 [Asterias amurensis]|uniref:post-GPI attachment to proteins factor 6-like isoform X2 n=1 Tax=Asterias amurensis TaxID=7602 RepID=UPI003AB3F3D6